MKCDHEVETNVKASNAYKGDIIANSNKLHNLDLSLRMSASSKQLNNNNFGVGFSSGCTTYMIPQERGTMVPLFTISIFFFFKNVVPDFIIRTIMRSPTFRI
jgi:hypothetical protein